MKVLFVSSEVAPFAKAGGLGLVMGSLPQALEKLGAQIAIFMPFYGVLNTEETIQKYQIKEIENSKIKLKFGTSEYFFTLKMAKIPNSNINIFFIDSLKYFSCFKSIYPNNIDLRYEQERYIVFCRATLEYIQLLNFKPDIIHLNDWHSAPITSYIKYVYQDNPFFKNTKIIFTIHNLAYQGVYFDDVLDFAQIPKDKFFESDKIKDYQTINWLQEAIKLSDSVVTVSPRYATEIQTQEYGMGLQDILIKNKNKIVGILNGIDYSIYNPKNDINIKHPFSVENLQDKEKNKQELAKNLKLDYQIKKPYFAMISRLVEQKGFDIIINIAKELAQLNANFIIIGNGDDYYINQLQKISNEYKNIYFSCGYNDNLSQQIYAGSDFLLMPSKFEPCGISQLIAMKYGCIPIVRAVGGLDDTVIGYPLYKANGFKFWEYNADALLNCIKLAINCYLDNSLNNVLRTNAMQADFSWGKSAKKYFDIYNKLLLLNI